MRNQTLWRIIASGLLTVAAIAAVQTYWLVNSFSRAERTFDEKVHIALRHVAEEISQLTQVQLPSQKLITKISQDYYVVNIQDAINAQELEFFLRQELENLSLQTDFEYGIYDCASDEMVYGNYIQYKPGQRVEPNTSLERYDDYVYYFGVRFPDRKGYVLNSHWIPIAFTALLFAAVLFFLYAVKEILKQRKLSDLQKDFINNMTHEFKTPLSSIKISADVLLQHPSIQQDPKLKTYAGIIQSQGEHLSNQVERVLQIADVRRGSITLEKQPVDMHVLINEVIADQIESATKSDTVIETDLQAGSSVVLCDRHHMTNILHNLL
ncbi:MAG: HAMP domain-containing histidine kinase, partial [Saprospiraceae bacterium]|nr:HAMP domain-containing histidine kinase [Saprospiraceae bacterium]